MASSSSSSSISFEFKYDVFLSFRGEDTRPNFTSHLYAALCRKQIQTFIDDEGLKRGNEISPMLLKAIQNSKISVIIFSNDYASSSWCLDELEKILECKDKNGQRVIPIFYHIDPSDLRKQTGSIKDAFVKHEERFKEVRDKVQKWRSALTKVANLSGWNSTEFRTESKLVDKVVEDILEKLNVMPTSRDYKELVGLNSRIEKIKSLLCIGSSDIRVVGIWGMGGIGKTTLADAVYYQVSSKFEGKCFINVGKESEKDRCYQKRDQVFSQLLGEDIKISTPSIPQYIQERIQRKNVFIVLDDVTIIKQMEFLVGGLNQFGPGSRIIVTTRDKHVLKSYGVDNIYEVARFNDHESLQLFSIYAFKQNHPLDDFDEFSKKVVGYANGNPLALKVLGSSLCRKTKEDWKSVISNLKSICNTEVHDVLKISYKRLKKEEKEIFLDIACFFKGEDRYHVTQILHGYYESTHFFLTSLIDKSLIFESNEKKLEMHDLLQEMGQEIVCQESDKKPEERSRLWDHEDIYSVLVNNKGTDSIEGISLNMFKIRDLRLSSCAFTKMTKLRLLKFYNHKVYKDTMDIFKVQLPRGLKYLPNELRYLHWDGYPSKKLPSKFSLENIVELRLTDSKLKQLWKGTKHPSKLKFIHLQCSKNLTGIPDLSDALGLEVINLQCCTSLVDVHSSVGSLKRLHKLDLFRCASFRGFSGNIHFGSRISLNLSYCSKLKKFPQISGNIKYLDLSWTAIEEVPPSIECLTALIELKMQGCKKLKCLTTNICKLKSLEMLCLSDCPKLKSFPEILEPMEHLRTLRLCEATTIKELPSSIEHLSGLLDLSLRGCINLESIPSSTSNLTSLRKIDISGCLKVEKFPNCVNLEILDAPRTSISEISSSIATSWKQITTLNLASCKLTEIPEDLCCMSSLEELNLIGNNFESLPASIKQFSQLRKLFLSYCAMLQSIPELPYYLIILEAIDCEQLRSLPRLNASKQKGGHVSEYGKHKFCFINSFKLNENEYNKILAEAQQLIQDMALTVDFDKWICKGDLLSKSSFGLPLSTISLCGNKIPDWISYQSSGSFLTIELSQYWFNKRFHGFVLGVVIGVEGSFVGKVVHVRCASHFEPEFSGNSYSRSGPLFGTLKDSNFVVLLYFPHNFERIIAGEYRSVSFRFNLIYHSGLEIKFCGACPIYI